MHERVRILHDPLAYYRPWSAVEPRLAGSQRSALNRWIRQAHALPPAAVDLGRSDPLADRLIRGWWRVPAAAWFVACAGHRRHVLGTRWMPTQPPALHAFLRLGFPEAGVDWPQAPTPDLLLAWGGKHLQRGLHGQLPDWLHARMALWFVGLPDLPASATASTDPFDMTCFLSAWNHAADLS
ncbi:hypothetical protein [Stenotrophomonas sp. NPDC078853]|jgi:hypothetical protein|uniref:hypothetical protein n=1 Tax=Stenotrophomonas sp. NPDC078853 TaxID=3364534 RepID=UPI00384FD73C